jgi:hypothetical protein
MISHYVEVHHYRPPEEFQRAVLTAPLPGTDAYRQAVAPFRALYLERTRRSALRAAAQWARDQMSGRTSRDEAIRLAAAQFLRDTSAEVCDAIRAEMDEPSQSLFH